MDTEKTINPDIATARDLGFWCRYNEGSGYNERQKKRTEVILDRLNNLQLVVYLIAAKELYDLGLFFGWWGPLS